MEEAAARAWIRKMVEVIREGLTITPTTVDDGVADMVLRAIDNDLLWSWLWSALDGVLDPGVTPIGATPPETEQELVAKGVNPLLVLSIVKAIYDLWKMFRS
jgi:hypothetical protein